MAVSARDIERYLAEEEPFKLLDGPATIAFEPVGSGCWRITAMRNGHMVKSMIPEIDCVRVVNGAMLVGAMVYTKKVDE